MAFDRIHTSESWKQSAQICAVMATIFSKRRKYSIADFLPRRWGRKRELLPAEGFKAAMRASLRRIGQAMGDGDGK